MNCAAGQRGPSNQRAATRRDWITLDELQKLFGKAVVGGQVVRSALKAKYEGPFCLA
jgi:hypothetical protein